MEKGVVEQITQSGIREGDCVAGLQELATGSIDLAFADPPFNIGYSYDVYEDRREADDYVAWCKQWLSEVYRTLKPTGTFWLAIGDEYAAELKLTSQQVGFHCRSWVVWYYTFGVNCAAKFTRSHAHLFHFVKDPQQFTFRDDDLENRVPSARELIYNDKRANPLGRLPDDTWLIRPGTATGSLDPDHSFVLRPQETEESFAADEDTWYFPRVAGTFKERAGFHGCQMPEQLLGRIIRSCSEAGEVVMDPFSGSATTLAVAKKLGRQYLGFELSSQYVEYGRQRLADIAVGDPLSGSVEPTKLHRNEKKSARGAKNRGAKKDPEASLLADEVIARRRQIELTLQGVVDAYIATSLGYSVDRVITDPDLSVLFCDACRQADLVGDPLNWQLMLLRCRKAGRLAHLPTTVATSTSWNELDRYAYASEIALQSVLARHKLTSVDEVLCDHELAGELDQLAATLAPGFSSFEYRWAALSLRKAAKQARTRGAVLTPPRRFPLEYAPCEHDTGRLQLNEAPAEPAVYVVRGGDQPLYVGETLDLRQRLQSQFGESADEFWQQFNHEPLTVQAKIIEMRSSNRFAWQSCLARDLKPTLNYSELEAPVG